MRILVFGMGGIGGFAGGALARAGADVYFYARGKQLEAISQKGLHVSSAVLGDFTVRPKGISHDGKQLGKMDVILLACKGNGLEDALRDMAPMIQNRTIVIPLLNGVLVSELMEPLLPPCRIADGTIRVFSHLEKPGYVVQTAGSGKIVMGMKEGENPPALYELAALFRKGGIPAEVTENIALDSWEKYALMGSNSALFCQFDGPAGKVRNSAEGLKKIHSTVREVIQVAAAKGVRLPKEYEDNFVKLFTSLPEDTVTSLYRDLRSGKKAEDTETEMILGRMVRMGEETGVNVPCFREAYEKAVRYNS
ncbi:ketopantoate reductase family protein [Dialister sp.]|uniref:ketopantoate reductase family protein n=1 Tax=Dialister sp. TaxID=1955814 RepID=UPI003F029ACE